MLPSFATWFTGFKTVFVYSLRPFLPMSVLFFGFNGYFNGKMPKIKKNGQKSLFRGPKWFPKCLNGGFRGGICIKSATFGTLKIAKNTHFFIFLAHFFTQKALLLPNLCKLHMKRYACPYIWQICPLCRFISDLWILHRLPNMLSSVLHISF